VNLTDGQRLRQRLHEEFGALEFSPPPVLRVTGRGQGIRNRRRAVAAGAVVLAVAGGALSAHATGGRTARPPAVTVSVPDPAAPGGVFASGTADGKPWNLSVRNIAAGQGTRWCVPAVVFNGRDGDVLFKAGPGLPSFGNPALLPDIPGFPGVGALFTQVTPDVTRLVATFPDGRQVTVRPVEVRACGRSFRLAGYVVPDPLQGGGQITTYNRYGLDETLVLVNGATSTSLFAVPSAPGIWANLDKSRSDIAASHVAHPIGAGRVGGQIWHIRTSLGLFGQCYTATLRTPGHGRGQSSAQCVPVAAPPRAVALDPLSIPGATTELPGYAGLVNPRAAKVVVSIDNGSNLTLRPVTVAGRAYIAFAIPPGCQVYLVGLYNAAGHLLATAAAPSPAG
jgi:hypothetical protein